MLANNGDGRLRAYDAAIASLSEYSDEELVCLLDAVWTEYWTRSQTKAATSAVTAGQRNDDQDH